MYDKPKVMTREEFFAANNVPPEIYGGVQVEDNDINVIKLDNVKASNEPSRELVGPVEFNMGPGFGKVTAWYDYVNVQDDSIVVLGIRHDAPRTAFNPDPRLPPSEPIKLKLPGRDELAVYSYLPFLIRFGEFDLLVLIIYNQE